MVGQPAGGLIGVQPELGDGLKARGEQQAQGSETDQRVGGMERPQECGSDGGGEGEAADGVVAGQRRQQGNQDEKWHGQDDYQCEVRGDVARHEAGAGAHELPLGLGVEQKDAGAGGHADKLHGDEEADALVAGVGGEKGHAGEHHQGDPAEDPPVLAVGGVEGGDLLELGEHGSAGV